MPRRIKNLLPTSIHLREACWWRICSWGLLVHVAHSEFNKVDLDKQNGKALEADERIEPGISSLESLCMWKVSKSPP